MEMLGCAVMIYVVWVIVRWMFENNNDKTKKP